MFFWNSLAFSMTQQMLAIWSLIPFLNPVCTSGSSWFMYCSSLVWRILSITLLTYEMNAICGSLNIGIALLWDRNENWPFPVLWLLLSFPNLLAYWVQHYNSIIFWNSSAEIALSVVMLLRVHLTSHSKMSGSRWVITPLWSSGSSRSFLYSYFMYSCHLFLISSTSVRSILFLSFIVLIFAWNIPLLSLVSWRDL